MPVRMNQFLRAAFADALDNPTRDDTLNHFSHCHLLQHCHLSGIKCNFCNVTIYAQGYACLRCDYYIHDVCSNFPREIHHDFHPGYDHTLVLKHFQLANDDEQFHCAACSIDDSELSLFLSYYCCDSCNFNLHVECASIPTTLNLKVKYPLHLFFSLPMNGETASLSCSICTKVVPTSGCWVFYNHDHVYLCHFDCAAVIEFSMETDSLGQLQNRLQTLAITSRPPARANQPSGGVTHFTHRHSLKEYGSAKSLRCTLCNFAFMKGYICVGCNYFIDNICFSLPSMIQHMSHPQHPLKLTWYSDFQNGNKKCPACQYYTDHTSGWAYCCTKCDFFVDRFGASAPKTLTLANVNYKLFFSFPFKHEKAIIRCNICFEKVMTKYSLLYYNMDSDETMHVSCSLFEESISNHEEMVNSLSIQRLSDLRIAD